MKYKKAFQQQLLASVYLGIMSSFFSVCLLGLVCVSVCLGGGVVRIKRFSARKIFARVGALVHFGLDEHNGERTCTFTQYGQLRHPFPSRKSFILPHLSDPSASFIKLFNIFNFSIFWYFPLFLF